MNVIKLENAIDLLLFHVEAIAAIFDYCNNFVYMEFAKLSLHFFCKKTCCTVAGYDKTRYFRNKFACKMLQTKLNKNSISKLTKIYV